MTFSGDLLGQTKKDLLPRGSPFSGFDFRHSPVSEKPITASPTVCLAGRRCVSFFWDKKLHQLLDVSVQQVNRRDFAGMGADPHDKILADSIDDEEAVIVTADR